MRKDDKRIGDFISRISDRNREGTYSKLLGINIDNFFMPSIINRVGVNLKNYKIVKQYQFACNRMHVGRDYRIPIAMSNSIKPFIVSPAYDVFEVTKPEVLMPEYLMLWFKRKEYDRNAWFHTDGDVRGGLPWEAFCDIKINIPSIEKQREIVAEYQAVENKIKTNEQICEKLEAAAQALYKHWFVDFEFPNEEDMPYKSSGGAMVYNEELEKEIPEGWEVKELNFLLDIKYGKSYKHLNQGKIPLYGSGGIMSYVDDYLYDKPSVLIPRKGTLTNIIYIDEPFWSVDTMFYSILKNKHFGFYTFWYLKNLDFIALNVGSAVPSMTTRLLNSMDITLPNISILKSFSKKLDAFHKLKKNRHQDNNNLRLLQEIILSRMVKNEI